MFILTGFYNGLYVSDNFLTLNVLYHFHDLPLSSNTSRHPSVNILFFSCMFLKMNNLEDLEDRIFSYKTLPI